MFALTALHALLCAAAVEIETLVTDSACVYIHCDIHMNYI